MDNCIKCKYAEWSTKAEKNHTSHGRCDYGEEFYRRGCGSVVYNIRDDKKMKCTYCEVK